MKKKYLLILSLLSIYTATAQQAKDSIEISFNPYLLYRGHITSYDKSLELQENVSRVGAKLAIKKGNLTFLAASELHINLFQGGANFNVDGNTSGDFLDVETVNTSQTFSNRLGYIGINFSKYGTLTFGKQWSAYYDVTSYTDNFIVFGGRASATYIGGTDGGATGTGRADQSVIYRNNFGKFYIGAQTQLRGGNNNKYIDGFGFSAQYEITNELTLGASFNRTLLNNSLINDGKIIGLRGQPTYYAAGIKYQGNKLALGLVGVIQKNGDFAQGSFTNTGHTLVFPTVVFDAKGLGFYSKYNFDSFTIRAGYNLYVPDTKSKYLIQDNQSPLNSHFKVNDIIVGFSYQANRFVQVYGEQRISSGHNALNVKDKSVFALGLIFDVSKTFNTRIALDKD